ncbi:MAG: AAA family ATPase [Chloroflexi bacterium]|nr:AAA family ATPase [Chloroflexota bacterium]
MSQNLPVQELKLSPDLVRDLMRLNPWWEAKAGPVLPLTRRSLVGMMRRRLQQGLAPIVVVRGPRQIGKTTAQLHLIEDLLFEGVSPTRILRVQFDEIPALGKLEEPILRIVDWYERVILKATLNESARRNEPAYLFFDEIQNLSDWAPQAKSLVDAATVQAVVTGSSALRIELGRDSLAGRITSIEAGTLSLTEIGQFQGLEMPPAFLQDNGLEPLTQKDFWIDLKEHGARVRKVRDAAFRYFSDRGAYPLAHRAREIAWSQIADQLNDTVIKRVIQHDLRVGDRGRRRDPALLEELFRLSCRYIGQSPDAALFAREAQRSLHANVGTVRVQQYVQVLANSLLIRLIEPLEIRLKKKRGSPKICLVDHGLRASWLQEIVPLAPEALERSPHLTDLAGRVAESAAGAMLATIGGLDLAHFPARPREPEIDYVMTIGVLRIPVEIKYRRRIDALADTEGLRTFLEKAAYNAPFGLLVTQTDEPRIDDPRIICLPLCSLMLLR